MNYRKSLALLGLVGAAAGIGYLAFRLCADYMDELKYAKARKNIQPIEVIYHPANGNK